MALSRLDLVPCPFEGCPSSVRVDHIARHLRRHHRLSQQDIRKTSNAGEHRELIERSCPLVATRKRRKPVPEAPSTEFVSFHKPSNIAPENVVATCPFCDKRFVGTHVWRHVSKQHSGGTVDQAFLREYGGLPDGPLFGLAKPKASIAYPYSFQAKLNDPDPSPRFLAQGGRCNGR